MFSILSDRAFILDWSPQTGSHTCYWHDLFEQPGPSLSFSISSFFVPSFSFELIHQCTESSDIDWNVKSIEGLLNNSLTMKNALSIKFDDPLDLDAFLCANLTVHYEQYPLVILATDEYFLPLFRHGFHRQELRDVFDDSEPFHLLSKFLFRPRQVIQNIIDEFYRTTFRDRGCEVGLQIRHYGIGEVLPNNTNIFYQCTQQLLKEIDNNNNNKENQRISHENYNNNNNELSEDVIPRIFLTTDTNATREEAQRILGSTQVTWYSDNVRSQLVQSCDEIKNALIDLYLLSRCKHIIGTKNTQT